MKHFLFALTILTSVSFCYAQQSKKLLSGEEAKSLIKESEKLILNEQEEITFVQFEPETRFSSIEAFKSQIAERPQKVDFIQKSVNRDQLDFDHHRIQQTYNGIRLIGAEMVLHTKNGTLQSASGIYVNPGKLTTTARLSEEDALKLALADINANSYIWDNARESSQLSSGTNSPPHGELVFTKQKYRRSNPYRLAYKFEIYATNPLGRYAIEIDAVTGEVLNKYDLIHHHTSTEGAGVSLYDGDVELTLDFDGTDYYLADDTRGNGIFTYDMQRDYDYSSAVLFSEEDNYFNEDNSKAGVSAHFGAAATYDYFFNQFGRDSYDNNGAEIHSYVHFGDNYVNAFWDGFRMTYGDGDGFEITPLVSLDIVGHEITHAVTQYSANLIYAYESGALNESFSDIFGQAVEFEAFPETASWNLADQIFTDGVSMIRSMSDPNSQGDPDTYQGNFWEFGDFDNGGVHINSGVMNYWFYLLVEGGSGTNDNGFTYGVSSIGLEAAEQIAYRNLTVYLTESSQYVDARVGAEQSAIDLFGADSDEHLAVIDAWNAVGVPTAEPLLVADGAADFGEVPIGLTSSLNFRIVNQGTGLLLIDDITVDNEVFSVSETSLSISSIESEVITISFTPALISSASAELTIYSNAGEHIVSLTGTGVEAPVLSYTPSEINEDLFSGDVVSRTISLSNSGGSQLKWSVGLADYTQEASTSQSVASIGFHAKQRSDASNKIKDLPHLMSAQIDSTSTNIPSGTTGALTLEDTIYFVDWASSELVKYHEPSETIVARLAIHGSPYGIVQAHDLIWVGDYLGNIYGYDRSGNMQGSFSSPHNVYNGLTFDGTHFIVSSAFEGSVPFYRLDVDGSIVASFDNESGIPFFQLHHSNSNLKAICGDPYLSINGFYTLELEEIVSISDSTKFRRLADYAYTLFDFNNELIAVDFSSNVEKTSLSTWVTLSANSGSIPVNSTEDIALTLDAANLYGGTYSVEVRLSTNDPENQFVTIPVTMDVTGAPSLSLDETEIDYGEQFIGASIAQDLTISNNGTDILLLSDISSDNVHFIVHEADLEIEAGENQALTIYFEPGSVADYEGVISFSTNDNDQAIVEIVVKGKGVEPPIIAVSPSNISSDLFTGESASFDLVISNENGGSDLDWTLAVEQTQDATSTTSMTPYRHLQIAKGEQDPRVGAEHFTTEGGPDSFGYSWVDSDHTNGPAFIWEDISSTGVEITGNMQDDNISGPYPLGFDFNFYGTTYTEFYVSSNGFITFDPSSGSGCCSGQPIPVNDAPNSFVAWAWLDGYPFGSTYYENFSDKTIIQFSNYGICCSEPDGSATVEIILYHNGRIKVNYLNLEGAFLAGYGTVGIENEDGTDGLQVAFNESYLHDELAILFSATPDWLSAGAYEGTVPAGNTSTIQVTLNAEGLYGGSYEGELIINSNDPVTPATSVQVELEVTGAPVLEAGTEALDFGDIFIGASVRDSILIRNAGTDVLTVSTIEIENEDYSIAETTFDLEPEETHFITITYSPSSIENDLTTLSISSNSNGEPTIEIELNGSGVEPPVISISPTDIVSDLFTGETASFDVSISNEEGGSELEWSIEIQQDITDADIMSSFVPNAAIGYNNSGLQVSSEPNGQFRQVDGEFETLTSSPAQLTCMAIDEESGYIYAQENYGYGFYRYDVRNDVWEELSSSPYYSSNNGGAVFFEGKIYTSYTSYYIIGIYDIASDTWSDIEAPLATGNIAASNSAIYLTAGDQLFTLDTASETFEGLATPSVYLDLWGGLSYYEGYLYAHAGNGFSEFARYHIESDSWETLESLPEGAVLGATVDKGKGIYYTYGNYGGSNFYAYDIAEQSWSIGTISSFSIYDGGMVYYPFGDQAGIYIIEGEAGYNFIRYSVDPYVSWISSSKIDGVVGVGESENITLGVDANDLYGGTYHATVVINSNDPVNPSLAVEVELNVTGVPIISVSQEAIEFDEQFIGSSRSDTLYIENSGTDLLTISSIDIDNEVYSLSETSLELEPASSHPLVITFLPAEVALYEALLTVTSNSNTDPSLTIEISGTGIEPPVMEISPSDIVADLLSGEAATESITISNENGGSDLEWTLMLGEEQSISSASNQQHDYLKIEKGEIDPRTGHQQILGSGGPDSFGYSWIDSDEANGPTFLWEDIATTGTDITGNMYDDNVSGPYPLGFDFEFYGQTYTQFYVSSNGFITFNYDSSDGCCSGQPIPNDDYTNNLIAWSWRDGYPFGNTYYQNFEDKTIVQFTGYGLCCNEEDGSATMEIILYKNGNIKLNYLDLEGYYLDGYGTVGIENADGTDGLQVAFNESYLHDELSVLFSITPDWLSANSYSGVVAAGASETVEVTLNAAGLNGGSYSGELLFTSNDPVNPTDIVDVTLNVTGVPFIAISDDNLNFGEVFINDISHQYLTISNTGTDDLIVSDVSTDNNVFMASETSFVLSPSDSKLIEITYAPTEVSNDQASLTITNNSANEPTLSVNLSGSGVEAPAISFESDALNANLDMNESKDYEFVISNNGGSALQWNVVFDNQSVSGLDSKRIGFYADESRVSEPGNQLFTHRQDIIDDGVIVETTGIYMSGDTLYALNYWNASIIKYQLSTSTIVDETYIHSDPYGITMASNILWIGNSVGNVYGYSLNGELTGSFSLPSAEFNAITYDGSYFIVTASFNPYIDVSKVDVDGTVVDSYINSTDQYLLQFTSLNGALWSVSDDGTGVFSFSELSLSTEGASISDSEVIEGADFTYSLGHASSTLYAIDWIGTVHEKAVQNWISLDRYDGVVSSRSNQTITITFDSEGLDNGSYETTLLFYSNDPVQPSYPIAVKMEIGEPYLEFETTTFNVEGSAGSMTLSPATNIPLSEMSMEMDVDWLSAEMSGSDMVVSYSANSTSSERTGIITVSHDLIPSVQITVHQAVGVTSINDQVSIGVYPNPTRGIVSLNHKGEVSSIELVDISGKLVPFSYQESTEKLSIDLEPNSDGIYYLLLHMKDGTTKYGKILLEK